MSDRGAAPLELAAGVLLVLVPIALLVLSFGPWLGRRSLVRSAAAEAARYLIVSNGDEEGAAQRVASMVLNNGYPVSDVRLAFCGGLAFRLTEPAVSTCGGPDGLERDAPISVRVEMEVPGVMTVFGTVGSLVTAYEHTEIVEPYRSMP